MKLTITWTSTLEGDKVCMVLWFSISAKHQLS